MSNRDLFYKTTLFFLIMAYYLGGYFLINEYTASLSEHYTLAYPGEANLPFVPGLILGYMLIFVILGFTYAVITDLDFFKKTVLAFFLCITIHFAFFLLFPVEFTLRPDVDPTQGWAYRLVHYYYWLDLPYNCFPSMHISNCFLVSFILLRYRLVYGLIIVPLALLVAISCVLVKQHYVADVVAGLGVAWFCFYWVFVRQTAQEEVGVQTETAEQIYDN